MMLRFDFSYAADTARFGLPEVKRGFMPGSGGTQRLPRVMGEHRAKELIMSGEQFTAQEALAWGLVNKVLPPAELLAATLDAASRIAGNPPRSVQVLKQYIHTGLQADHDTGLVLDRKRVGEGKRVSV